MEKILIVYLIQYPFHDDMERGSELVDKPKYVMLQTFLNEWLKKNQDRCITGAFTVKASHTIPSSFTPGELVEIIYSTYYE